MGFGTSTRRRRDGVSQQDRRAMKRLRLIAEMNDGTTRDVPTLCDYEDLRKAGTVKQFKVVA